MEQQNYRILGLMSGTSLDGLDISDVKYFRKEGVWNFELMNAQTIAYPVELLTQLENATQLNAVNLQILDYQLGVFFAEKVNQFCSLFNIEPSIIDAIASHGHTIYHQPERRITVQIGCGTALAYRTGINVINDFRKKDVIAGGQGAPLVPIGDLLLFGLQADSFLNIGGFANLSFRKNGHVRAFDICPANILINLLTRKIGHSYDAFGEIASSYPFAKSLLKELNAISTYQEIQPKSLGTEWLEKNIVPLVSNYDCAIENKIATVTEHAAFQIAKRLNQNKLSNVFVTGGGAKNTHLIKRISASFTGEIIIPEEKIIDFKEAIIFGFLGVLYLEKTPNCLSSVTGAKKDVIGGVLHSAE